MPRFALSLAFVAIVAAVPAGAQELAAAEARARAHTPVSNDGTVAEAASEAWSTEFAAFEGLAPELMADDLAAERRAEVETAEQVWALLEAQPATGRVGLESIIGPDTRTRTNPTTSYPARAVVLVTYNQNGSSYRCSGNLINANTVLTAGHCVHAGNGLSSGWSSNVVVYPGRNGSSSPYGSCTAKRLYSVTGWTNGADERYDYGAIKLNCQIGNTVGWFGYYWQAATLNGVSAVISGYPGDKPLTQWRSTGSVAATQTLQVFYKNDTLGGMSGSGVYWNKPSCGQCIHSVHAYGLHGAAPHSNNNHATRITKAVFDNLAAWTTAP